MAQYRSDKIQLDRWCRLLGGVLAISGILVAGANPSIAQIDIVPAQQEDLGPVPEKDKEGQFGIHHDTVVDNPFRHAGKPFAGFLVGMLLLAVLRSRLMQRSAKRRNERKELKIVLPDDLQIVGHTINVSESGLLVTLPIDLSVGDQLRLLLGGPREEPISRSALVVRKDSMGNVGLKFI